MNVLRKGLNLSKKIKLLLYVAGIFEVFILLTSQYVFAGSFGENVENSIKKYGNYAFKVDSTDSELVDKLKSNRMIDDVFYWHVEENVQEGYFYSYYYMMEDNNLSDVGISIISGNYPENENEILRLPIPKMGFAP